MTRKIIFAAVVAIGLLVVSASPLPATIQAQSPVFSEEIPNEVIALACQKVEKEKITTADVAMCWYRDGLMTITKVDSGVYLISVSGGSAVILILEAVE